MYNMDSPLWTITRISDTSIFVPNVGSQPAKRIEYRLYDGESSYVDVILSDFNPGKIEDKLNELAAQYATVKSLAGPPAGQVFAQAGMQLPEPNQ